MPWLLTGRQRPLHARVSGWELHYNDESGNAYVLVDTDMLYFHSPVPTGRLDSGVSRAGYLGLYPRAYGWA